MGKYTGNFEDLFTEDKIYSKEDHLYGFADEESKYWIHRTVFPDLVFNTNFKKNGCPMILTINEMNDYVSKGKEIKGCISLDSFYDSKDEYSKKKVLKVLEEEGLTQDDLEYQIKNKCISLFESFLENGIYVPDVYSKNITRTAEQHSVRNMHRLVGKEHFGWNGMRGRLGGVILEIPRGEQDVTIPLSHPVEIGTEYFGVTKVSKAISPEYIKGFVVRFGEEVFFIKNERFIEKSNVMEEYKDIDEEKRLYLFETEKIINSVFEKYKSSNDNNKVKQLIEELGYIKRKFLVYASLTADFKKTTRYVEMLDYISSFDKLIDYRYVRDKSKNDFINDTLEKRHYDSIKHEVDEFLSISDNKNINL